MDDNLSIKSSDSVTTSGEYEIVPEELELSPQSGTSPTLKIANNGNINDLEKNLNEMIRELDRSTSPARRFKMDETEAQAQPQVEDEHGTPTSSRNVTKITSTTPDINKTITARHAEAEAKKESTVTELPSSIIKQKCSDKLQSPEQNKVGLSVFYDCIDLSPMAEKQDDMKPERSDTEEEMSEIDQDCTIFSGVTYLASATINAPKSETEIQRKITELNLSYDDDAIGLKVSISIPSCSEGLVVLHDATTNAIIAHYEVSRILYYARGPVGSTDQACFAFTWATMCDSPETTVFQCHVFRCHIPEAVNQVSSCFARSFQRPLPLSLTNSTSGIADSNSSIMIGSITSDTTGVQLTSAGYEFTVSLQIREKIAKNYTAATRDRSSFKLRCNTDKEVVITVKQTPSTNLQPLHIERCFGVLLSPGKLVRQADMQLLDMVNMGYVKDEKQMSGQTATVAPQVPSPLSPYVIRAEWKANDKNFEQLNLESAKMYITVAVDLVIKGIREPVRFIIETTVAIQSQNEIRLMDHFNFSNNKKSMAQRFYLQLKDSGEGSWEVSSIDPSEEIVEATANTMQSSLLKNFGSNISKMVRSTSAISIEQDDSAGEYSSDGDEPLLSGTGEVSRDCSQDTLDEWKPLIQDWGEKRPKALSTLVRMGIPEALRGSVWQRLANVENKSEIIDMYRVLLTKETNCESLINRDIHRTFPAHKFFKETGGSGQDALFKVSKAYAVYDSEVGYCQGLSFIAASLLLHMPEEEAFCVLVSLMYDYGLRDLYKDGFENLYLRLYQLSRLIQDQLPRLHEHFENHGVETHMFASQWFLTLFNARFPLYFVFHVLDVVLLDGMDITFQVAMTLLEKYESDLRQHDFEGMLKFFRVVLAKKCRNTNQARKLMKIACDKKVKKLKQYKEEFIANKEAAEKEEQAMKQYEARFEDERKKLKTEISSLRENLAKTNNKSNAEMKRKTEIIDDYKQIIQRHEQQITKLNDLLTDFTTKTSKCAVCSSQIDHEENAAIIASTTKQQSPQPLGPLDPLVVATDRIRELELELAQTKLAHVEAQCRNQDLNHQLNTTLTEIQNHRTSWQPWLSKTFTSLQEKVSSTRRDVPTFQAYTSNSPTPSCNSLENSQDSPNMRHRRTISNDSNTDQTKCENTMNSLTSNSIIK